MKIFITTGEKGGVGKTTLAKALGNYTTAQQRRWSGIDTDQANKGFRMMYPDQVKGFSFFASGGMRDEESVTALANHIAEVVQSHETDILLIDIGAAQLDVLLGSMRETGIFDLLGAEIEITALFTIVNTVDSVSTLKNSVHAFDELGHARWIVVRNQKEGKLTLYDESKSTRHLMMERGACEIDMKLVPDPRALAAWSRSRLPLSDFIKDTREEFGLRGRLATWWTALRTEFDRIELLA